MLILAYSGSRLQVSYRTTLTGCARDPGTGGAAGLFRWADRIGIPARRLEVPIAEAAQALGEPTGNVILTMGDGPWDPSGEEPEPASWQDVRGWIARGNTLIVVTNAPRKLPPALRTELLASDSGALPASPTAEDPVDGRPQTGEARLADGRALTVEAKGPRWDVSSTRGTGKEASSSSTAPAAENGDRSARRELAGDGRGGVLFRIPVGQGAVYLLLDDFAWTNAGFDRGDNASVLAGILGREIRGGGVLAFDEHRHGHGRTGSFLTYLLNLPGSSAFMQLAALWAVLYVYGRNVRLRKAEVYVERERRTAQEYIDAVAQLYERARAAPLVVAAVARRLRQVSRSSAGESPAVDALLRRAEDSIAEGERPAKPAAATRLVNELIQLRKRIYGNRTVS